MSKQSSRRVWFAVAAAALIVGLASLARRYRAANTVEPPITSSQADQDVESNDRPASPSAQLASYPFAQYGQFPDGYVGTAVCASCHANRHASYLKTHHSRSLREVELGSEKYGETLDHPLSKRSYDIVAKEGRLWHREWRHLSDRPDDKFRVHELPVCYVMGSGAFAKGYLLSDGEFLLQSPVTWYVGGNQFGMAPGYDAKHNLGFARMISDECLFCHAGLVRRRNDNPHHPVISELAIGCERCHGPGQDHTDLFRKIESGDLRMSDDLDPKIVDPKKLSRVQSESICGQCHLHGDVTVDAAGAKLWDFVPGADLAETRVHYKDGKPGEFRKVFTGHFDQMWQSRCYQESETLTCVTCHDPHQIDPIADRVAHRREQCNGCHAEQGCGLAIDLRLARGANDCIECHMPSIGSDVPHTSTTNHWIAVYQSGKPRGMEPTTTESSSSVALRRVQRSPALSREEIARRDLLARAFWAVNQGKQGDTESLRTFTEREKLPGLLRDDRTDAEIYSLLARMDRLIADAAPEDPEDPSALEARWKSAGSNAIKSLQLEERPVEAREIALEVLGNQRMQADDYAAALGCFSELTRIRRVAVDWYHVGLCLAREQRIGDAEQALREAIRIDATYAPPYRSLSILYRTMDPAASRQFAVMAQRLVQP